MTTPIISIVYAFMASILAAIGFFLYKEGAQTCDGSFASFIRSPKLFIGLLCFFTVVILMVASLRNGGEAQFIYPIFATTFIWGAIIAHLFYETPLKWFNWFGMLCLIASVFLVVKQ